MKFIFFGAGYCSKFLIPLLPKKAEIICTHNKQIKKYANDKKHNIKRILFDDFLKNRDFFFKGTNFILNSIPPDPEGDIVFHNLSRDIIKNKDELSWFGYFSSTSVYGDHKGKWVDEETPLKPSNSRGKLRKKAEEQFLTLFNLNEIPIHIFRLPGIYGPNRSVFDRLRGQKCLEIIKKNHFFSRIHVEDIASALKKSMKKITPGEIFNITDDMPCSSSEVIRYAAKLLGINKINSINYNDPELPEKVRSFYNDNKKVKNKKIKKILEWTPKFRDYKLGLNEIFQLSE